jgi:GT2 family glycosyltransferase
MTPDPSIGVVVLNWNGYDDTAAALQSLADASPRPGHVVVVDNGSADDSVNSLEAWARAANVSAEVRAASSASSIPDGTWLRILCAGENRGFAGGNNIGLAHLASDTSVTHFLLLNNDALIAADCIERLSAAVRAVPRAGLVGCVIYHYPETDRVWFAGGYEDRARGVALHRYQVPPGSAPVPTEWITGCAMLISRDLYGEIGGLAECYFPIYCEDSDYSFRARLTRRPVLIAPTAHVYHKVGGTVGVSSVVPRVAYWQNRHRVFYIRRNYRGFDRLRALGYLAVAKPVRAALDVLRGRQDIAAATITGVYHGLRDDPR